MGVSTGISGTCYTSALCPSGATEDGQFPDVCTSGGRCCVASLNEVLCNETGINTAIGCIPVGEPNDLIGFILRWAMGIGGGIAFLLILVAGFMIITSQGSPDKIQAGKELLTSAIAGLLLIIFSVFILELIGVDILEIPGFGA